MSLEKWISKQPSLEELVVDHSLETSINVLRPSSIAGFIRCPYQWYLVHIMGRRQKPAAASSAGTSVHAGAEHGYKCKIAFGELPKKSECVDLAVATWDDINNNNEELVYNEGENKHLYTDHIAQGMEMYYDVQMCVTDPVAVERRYTVELDHPFFKAVSGTLDIVLEKGVADIKFTKRASTIMHYTIQQSTYAWLRESNGEPVDILEIHNVVRPQKSKGAQVLVGSLPKQIEYSKFWIAQILDTVDMYQKTMNPLLFRGCSPDSNHLCNSQWCGFWHECPYVEGYRTTQIKEVPFDV